MSVIRNKNNKIRARILNAYNFDNKTLRIEFIDKEKGISVIKGVTKNNKNKNIQCYRFDTHKGWNEKKAYTWLKNNKIKFTNIVKETFKCADWDTAFINNLPDSAFAVLEPAYVNGDTEDKNARHLPHHDQQVTGRALKNGRVRGDSDATVDMPHFRNALARVNQIKPITDSISQNELIEIAREHLEKHRDLLETTED